MYPVWYVPGLTAGLVLGLIASFHILPSHLSTGAMWLNVYLEHKAEREGRPELLDFVRRYSKLLLIFAYVFGSRSGVGIWFAATVAAPRGISGLIHNYVWGWATEWVFFIIEVAGIFVYVYTFDKVDRKTHLRIGWVFALASWTTMVIIVGILTFMLTPGLWPRTGGFFDGFFNRTYWPQLFLRTGAMLAIAAAYATAVASRVKEEGPKRTVVRAASVFGLAGLAFAALCFLWYRASLPQAAVDNTAALVTPGLKAGMAVPAALLAGYFGWLWLKPSSARLVPALAALVVVFGGIFAFERGRELIRKPYVIPSYMYSNEIISGDLPAKGVKSELASLDARGVLQSAPFVPDGLRTVTDANRLQAGRLVALIECSACHSLSRSGVRPLGRLVSQAGLDADSLDGMLSALDSTPYMPAFAGTDAERRALAEYLTALSKGKVR
ncbi:MAG: cytochrome ubiquinol oxidase subunit I [Elusimicrobia bacterium]|nr:cytochrome ubiquinol oxidase subunit I [Elusimicrobiota bacterium]